MRYAQIDPCEIVNGNGVGVSLYVQGCPIHCKGCFNPETWDFDGGKEWTFQTEEKVLQILGQEYINRLSILGGEPLYEKNLLDLFLLISAVKKFYPEKTIWVWTGYTWEQLLQKLTNIKTQQSDINFNTYLYGLLIQIDYLIVGPFIEEEKDLTLLWRGSRNQKIIDIQQTLKNQKKTLFVL